MSRKKGNDTLAVQNAIGNRAPPIVSELDLALVEPDFVSTLLQVGLDALHKFFVGIVSVAQKDPQWS